jgi:arylsulfatase A-like enzyme
LLVARAKRWIEQHPVPRFFLFLHTYEIHTPYTAPPEYVRLFGDPDYKGGFHPGASYLTSIERRGGVLDEREHREVVARYDAGIRHTDEWVGDFIDWLEERGLLADALVVILSDHGEEFLEHGRFGHHQLYLDPNLRVPLLFHQRGLAPRVVDQTVELTDVVPTILEALGLPLSSRSVGRSLVPILRGEKAPEGRIAYAEKGAHPGEQTVITDRYQLIRNRKTEELRLYDLLADPEAKRDIAAEQPDLATRLGAELEKRRKRARKSLQENFGAAPRKEASQPLDDKIRRELELLGYLEQ